MIVYDEGRSFPIGGVVIGWMFFVVGILMLVGNPFLGAPMTILGSIMAFTKSMTLIDVEKNRIKKGASFLGFKFGEWIDYSKFPFIAVLRIDVKTKMLSRGNAEANLKDVYYNINLLSDYHRNKVLILKFSDKEKAITEARIISEKLEKELVEYRPVLSRKNQDRRRKRR